MFLKRASQSHLRKKRSSINLDIDNTNKSQSSLYDSEGNKKRHNAEDLSNQDDNESARIRLNSAIKSASKSHRIYKIQQPLNTYRPESPGPQDNLLQAYEGNRSLNISNDQGATIKFSTETAIGHDHRSILERNEELGKKILSGELEDGIYRGLGAYKPIINKREGAIAAGKYTGHYGPVRGADNVRMTMRIDLNPEICKDYKETGYCGFGDTCKFLHDRSDYKSGWQLEKEWNELQKQKQMRIQKHVERSLQLEEDDSDHSNQISDESDSDEDKIPFACLICKRKWQDGLNPVVTCCNHYFCEDCAFKHYAKSSKCFVCKTQTQGIFNSACDLIEKIRKKRNQTEN